VFVRSAAVRAPRQAFNGLRAHRYLLVPMHKQADIINRGFGGYTSKQAVEIVPEIAQRVDMKATALVVVWFGANDAVTLDGPQ